MLARDLATAKERPLLKDLVLVFAPIFNADGNEKIEQGQPPRAGRPRRRRRHARQRPGLRPQPRLRQAGKSRSARPGPLPQPVGPRRLHRLPHDQRLVPPLHASPTRAAAAPPATRASSPWSATTCCPTSAGGWRRRPATTRSSTATSRPTAAAGRRCRRRRATARNTSACATASPSCPSRTPTPPSRTASWPRAAFVKAICEYTAENKDKIAKLLSRCARRHDPRRQGAEADRQGRAALEAGAGRPAAAVPRLRGGGQGRQARLDRQAEGVRGPVHGRRRADAVRAPALRLPRSRRSWPPSWRTCSGTASPSRSCARTSNWTWRPTASTR